MFSRPTMSGPEFCLKKFIFSFVAKSAKAFAVSSFHSESTEINFSFIILVLGWSFEPFKWVPIKLLLNHKTFPWMDENPFRYKCLFQSLVYLNVRFSWWHPLCDFCFQSHFQRNPRPGIFLDDVWKTPTFGRKCQKFSETHWRLGFSNGVDTRQAHTLSKFVTDGRKVFFPSQRQQIYI